jgi:hypothetical protein
MTATTVAVRLSGAVDKQKRITDQPEPSPEPHPGGGREATLDSITYTPTAMLALHPSADESP